MIKTFSLKMLSHIMAIFLLSMQEKSFLSECKHVTNEYSSIFLVINVDCKRYINVMQHLEIA